MNDARPNPRSRSTFVLLAALGAAALGAVFCTPASDADTLVTIESSQAMTAQGEAQPERSRTVELWIGDGVVCRDDGDTRIVLRGNELTLISHRARTWNRLQLPVDPATLAPPAMAAQVRERLEKGKLSGTLTKTDESREVGDWTAQGYDLSLSSEGGMTVDMKIWAADLGVDAGPYNELTRALASLQVGGGDWVDQLAGVSGFPVLRETAMVAEGLEMTSTETVTGVERKEAPAGIYGPPDGYQEQQPPGAQAAPAEPDAPQTPPPADEQ